MPKGRKRTTEEYEREIEEAAKRMKKHPEFLRSARTSDEWQDFLQDIGVTTYKADFWESVRDKVYIKEVGFTQRRLDEERVSYEQYVRSSGKTQTIFRSNETGRFVSPKTID